MAHVTLGEAARQTGRSKSQISRAIAMGRLSAERSTETNSFRIEQSELQRWLDATDVIRATVLDGLAENPATGAEHAALEVQIERFKEAADLLRSQLADKCSQLADALAQRDEWREAFKQQRALPPPQPAPQGWGRWLALTTLLAIMVTGAIVAATAFAIWWFDLVVEWPGNTVDRLATEFPAAGAPLRSAALVDFASAFPNCAVMPLPRARTAGRQREIRVFADFRNPFRA
jgi:excisionase family DNA binding protein